MERYEITDFIKFMSLVLCVGIFLLYAAYGTWHKNNKLHQRYLLLKKDVSGYGVLEKHLEKPQSIRILERKGFKVLEAHEREVRYEYEKSGMAKGLLINLSKADIRKQAGRMDITAKVDIWKYSNKVELEIRYYLRNMISTYDKEYDYERVLQEEKDECKKITDIICDILREN